MFRGGRYSGALEQLRTGMADSHEDVEVRVSAKKMVWPRHVAILGATVETSRPDQLTSSSDGNRRPVVLTSR
jgi:hypothetical protein